MKRFDTTSQKSAGKKVEAPVQLKPDQLEAVAGGRAQTGGKGTSTTTSGAVGPTPTIKIKQ